MSDSVAPQAAQEVDEEHQQQDSSEQQELVSEVRAASRPPQADSVAPGVDDDWLDSLDTLPAPRGSEPPRPAPESKPPEAAEAAKPQPAEAIVPAPMVEVTPLKTQDAAPVVSRERVERERRARRKKKKARARAAKPERVEPAPAREPEPAGQSSWGPWLLLGAVAGAAALWYATRGEDAAPAEVQAAAVEAPVAQAPRVEATQGEPQLAVEAAPGPAPEAELEAPRPAAAAKTTPEPAAAPVDAGEPARLLAYKAVVEATKAARGCRHRGDAPGKIPVVVEFGSDGRVQRTDFKHTFGNPMTGTCIAAKFSGLTIPAFSGDPIVTTAEVSLR